MIAFYLLCWLQRKAEELLEQQRQQALEELSKMEEEAKAKIEEEVKKMQMMQLMMQQEALAKMEEAMRERMQKIDLESGKVNSSIDSNLAKSRDDLQAKIEERRQAKMKLLDDAWKAAEEQGNSVPSTPIRKTLLPPGTDLNEFESENRRMEAELAQLEAELAKLEMDRERVGIAAPHEDGPGPVGDRAGEEDAEAELQRLAAELAEIEKQGADLERKIQERETSAKTAKA